MLRVLSERPHGLPPNRQLQRKRAVQGSAVFHAASPTPLVQAGFQAEDGIVGKFVLITDPLRKCLKKDVLPLIYVVLSEMRVLPESARLLIDRFLSVQSTLTSILLSETKAAMISSKRIFGVLGFRTDRLTDETREIIFLYL